MKTMLIEVPINGNITNYEIERAKCNRLEYITGFKSQVPKIINSKANVKIKEGAGLYTFIQGCLP